MPIPFSTTFGTLPFERNDEMWDLTPQWCYNGVNQLAKHKENGDREAHRVIVPAGSQKNGLQY